MAGAAVAAVLQHIRRWVRRPPDDASTDGQLLERFTALGDEAAFAELVQRHGRLVYNVCLRILRDDHDAEDAFQAVFLVLARKAGSIRQRDSVASWLYGVAHRIAVRAKAQARHRSALPSESADMAQPDPADEAAWRELQPLLDDELARLPEKYKAPLLLCYFEGRSNEEAAQVLRWPSGTVKGRLARARELLRQRLEQRGLALPLGTVLACLSGQAMAASPPAELSAITVKATMSIVAGTATPAGMVSAQALALSQGELLTMFATKLKLATAFVLCAGLTVWTTVSGYQAWAGKPFTPTALPVALEAPQNASPAAADAKASPFEGRWTTKIEVGSESVTARVEFTTEAGKLKGVARLSKDKSFELQKIQVAGNKISFDCDAVEAELSFSGELKDGIVTGKLEMLGKNDGVKEGTFTMTRP
ncbi:MAG: RNA polymerase sigma factor [Planctomycetia bacterium]|nr:RNA polymerase sigma factor [Planctomycetia bacterium]